MRSLDDNATDTPVSEIGPAMITALRLLLQAHDGAATFARTPWDFALEIQSLENAGVNHNDLRTLICCGLAEHRVDRTRLGAKRRVFCKPRGLRLDGNSAFVLSAPGLLLARRLLAHDGHALPGCHVASDGSPVTSSPYWDRQRRELRVGAISVKRFRQPAQNQETILAAFQEEGWPPRIDNPLGGDGDTDSRDRLHNAVKKLNHQTTCVLRFLSDGNGLGVVWEFAKTRAPGAA